MTYHAIDEMIEADGKPRPERFGGGKWKAKEEFLIYKKQVGNRYTPLQWKVITSYFQNKLKEKNKRKKH